MNYLKAVRGAAVYNWSQSEGCTTGRGTMSLGDGSLYPVPRPVSTSSTLDARGATQPSVSAFRH